MFLLITEDRKAAHKDNEQKKLLQMINSFKRNYINMYRAIGEIQLRLMVQENHSTTEVRRKKPTTYG